MGKMKYQGDKVQRVQGEPSIRALYALDPTFVDDMLYLSPSPDILNQGAPQTELRSGFLALC